MNELDLKIIYELQKDPRKLNTDLAHELGISEASVRRRIAALIKSRTLFPTAIPNTTRLGYKTRAFIGLQVELSKVDDVVDRLVSYKELQSVAVCSGSLDISTYGLFRSNVHLAEFISTELVGIEGIVGIESMIELKCLKLTYGRLPEREPQEGRSLAEQSAAGKSRSDGRGGSGDAQLRMDKLGSRLIMELQRNSRRSNRQLARVLGVSEATVRRRISEYAESHLIELTAIPDANKVGLTSWAYLNLRVELPQLTAVAQRLAAYPDVHYVGICSGSYHLLVSVIFDSPFKLSQFITEELGRIDGIIRTDTLVQLRYEKRTFGWLDSSTPPFFFP